MTYLIGFLLLALIGCAVTIYRLSGEKETVAAINRELATDNHYLRERNKALNAELFSVNRTMLYDDRAIAIADLPAEHPQKRKRKTIRKKAP